MRSRARLDVWLIAGAVLLLCAVAILRQDGPAPAASTASTYDTGRRGYAALYDLLARERLAPERFELPIGEIPRRLHSLVFAGDSALYQIRNSRDMLATLDRWVRAGHTVYLIGSPSSHARKKLGIPVLYSIPARLRRTGRSSCGLPGEHDVVAGSFASGYLPGCRNGRVALLQVGIDAAAIAYRRGRGTIVLMTSAHAFDNWNLARRDDARFAYAIFAHAGTLAFDERVHGHAAGSSFWQILPAPVHAAIVIACAALLLALVGANLPFAPPIGAAEAGERDSSDYIASIARMLARGRAARDVIGRLTSFVQSVLRPVAKGDERAAALLAQALRLRALSNPSERDILAAGRLFATVRKEYR